MPKLAPRIALLLALAVPVLADGPPRHAGAGRPPAAPGKPRAPVAIDADVQDGHARVRLTFRSAAKDVAVHVYGVKGLRVTSAEHPLTGGSFAAGDAQELDVAFTAPAGGRSRLAIAVSGRFAGVAQSAVASFTAGAAALERRPAAETEVKTTPGGERLKKVPPPAR